MNVFDPLKMNMKDRQRDQDEDRSNSTHDAPSKRWEDIQEDVNKRERYPGIEPTNRWPDDDNEK